MELKITENRPKENTAVLSVEGRLNAVTVGVFKTKIKELVAAENIHLILDLSEVSFIDSSGLSAIVSGLKSTREKDGSLKLVGLRENTKRVFELTRLSKVFDFYPTVDEALST